MRAPQSRTLYELLCEMTARNPERLALISRGEALTYGTLLERATTLAARLREEGLRRGDRVGLLLSNRREWLELFFGVSALGATVVPFSTWSTRSELSFVLPDSRVRWLFALAQLGDRDFLSDIDALAKTHVARALERVVIVDDAPEHDTYRGYFTTPVASLAFTPGDGASAGDTLAILYTSGSSAHPKAVPLRHFATIENGFNIGERQGLGQGDAVFVPVPLFWSYGAINATPAILSHGATMVLQERFEPEEALALIEAHGCTAIYTLPTITNALLAHPTFSASRAASLRTGVTIGTPQDVRRAALELGAEAICNIYGSTETYGNCCVTPHDWPLEARSQCQGLPLPGVTVRIRNERSGAPCGPGEVGRIEVTGFLTSGYVGDSARHNAEVFTEDGYFRTGDLGALDEEGRLRFSGRSSEMIKRSGINVSPAEVEDVLQRHPDVAAVGVTGTPDERRDEGIVAFVVLHPGGAATPQALLEHCRAHLSRYKLPDRIEFSAELPLTPTGKLIRRELRVMAKDLPRTHGTPA